MSLRDPSRGGPPAAPQRALSFTSQSYGRCGPPVKPARRRQLGTVSHTRPPITPEDVATWDRWANVAPYLTLDDFDDDGNLIVPMEGGE